MLGGKPIVLIIHAQTKPPLVELDEEVANLQDALRKAGGCEPRPVLAANSERIFAELNDCGDRVVAIHYAGHANGGGVMLPVSGDGVAAAARLSHIEGLAGRLKQLKNLRFVFLNGCATKDQVTDIIEAEIPAVVATLRGIDDRVARDFATEFYRSLASDHSIDEAFQSAESRIKEHRGGQRRGAYSEAAEIDADAADDWPWKLYGTRDAKGWKLGDAAAAADDLSIAGQGFESLKTLVLQEPEVKGKVVSFQSEFTATREGIRVLNAYKAMHDVLHTLQFQCHDILANVCKMVHVGAMSDMAWAMVGPVENTLRLQLNRGDAFRHSLPPGDTMWFGDLESAALRLGEASTTTEPDVLADADNQINRVISVHLANINTRLSSQARNLRLDQSLIGLSKIAEWLDGHAADSEEAKSFKDGMEAFGRIDKTLATLVDRHDGWQNVDRELRPAEASLAIGTQLIVAYWPSIVARVNELCEGGDEAFAEKIRTAEAKLNAAIAEEEPNKIEPAFRDYYRLAMQQFYVVDLELKDLCGSLDEVGEKLSLVLRALA